MAGSDSERVERLKERLARPVRTRETSIEVTASAIAKRSRALRSGFDAAAAQKRDLEARTDALLKTYGRRAGLSK